MSELNLTDSGKTTNIMTLHARIPSRRLTRMMLASVYNQVHDRYTFDDVLTFERSLISSSTLASPFWSSRGANIARPRGSASAGGSHR